MTIKKPSSVDSPYQATATSNTRINTVSTTVSDPAYSSSTSTSTVPVPAVTSASTGSNLSYYASGTEGLNNLLDRGVVFRGANVYVTFEDLRTVINNTVSSGNGGNATPGGSNTQVQFNDAGVFGGDSGFTFNSVTSALTVDGNITASYFLGNGSQLTGITASANTGNIGFTGDTIYDLNGIVIENADLSHGATASMIMPINGGTSPIQLNNIYGNIFLQTGNNSDITASWVFANTGKLTLPQGSWIVELGEGMVELTAGSGNDSYASLASFNSNSYMWVDNTAAYIGTDYTGTAKTWTFDTDGKLTTPAYSTIKPVTNSDLNIFVGDPDNEVYYLTLGIDDGDGTVKSAMQFQYDKATIQTDGENNKWIFRDDGNLTLPSNTSSINYANGDPYGGGGGFSNKIVNGNSYANIADADGNLEININNNFWTFDTTGNLTLPGPITSSTDTEITAVDDVDIYGGDKTEGGSEGGDIYITGGTGAPDNGATTGSGGDVSITGGEGGYGVDQGAASGGEINIQAGPGGAANDGNSIQAGEGGSVIIKGGQGGDQVGNTELSALGGNVEILGGQGSFDVANGVPSGSPGHVNLYGGNWGWVTPSGNIYLNTYTGSDFRVWAFDNTGQTIFPTLSTPRGDNPSGDISGFTAKIGDGSAEAIISTPDGNPTAQRLVINPGKGADGTTGEGGDIYLWAGRGGDAGGTGGDVKIRGGQGMVDGAGGYIRIEGGDSETSGQAGYVVIQAGGTSGPSAGYVHIFGGSNGNGNGGDANLAGGYGTGTGGTVNITGGVSGQGLGDYGNVNINAGAAGWTFDNTGNVTVPGIVRSDNNIDLYAYDAITINSNNSGTTNTWQFNEAGNLTLPAGTIIDDVSTAGVTLKVRTAPVTIVITGADFAAVNLTYTRDFGQATPTWYPDDYVPGTDPYIEFSGGQYGIFNPGFGQAIYVNTGTFNNPLAQWDINPPLGSVPPTGNYTYSSYSSWTFDNTGNLTLPSEGNIVGATANNNGYLNWVGNSSGDGGGYTTMNIVPDDTRVGGDQYLIIDPTAPGHIHIRAGGTQDNSNAELYLGGENSYFKVDAGSNPDVFVAAAGERWQFSQGQLILANGNSTIQSIASSSLDPLNPNVSTMVLTPDPSYSLQALVLDPTAPGHIHLRAPSFFGNIDDPSANLFLGGETSSFEVGYGANANLFIHSNGNTWTFDNSGNLNYPDGTISIGGATYAAANASVQMISNNAYNQVRVDDANVEIYTSLNGITQQQWTFDGAGNLTLPGNIAGNTGGYAIGYRDIPQVTFSANATAAVTDAGKHYYSTTAGNLQLTLPDNSNVAFPTGATLTLVVNAAGNVLVNQGTGVTLYMAGSSTTGNRVVGAYGLASVMKVAANTWVISGTGVY